MKRDSVLELKQRILASLRVESERRAATTESLVNPRVEGRLAVGYSQKSDDEFQLELRVQSRKGKAFTRAQEYKEEAKGEANIDVVPRIEIPAKSAVQEFVGEERRLTTVRRPLHIGVSVGHAEGGAGTLGAFVADDDENVCILSNNHVLAPTKRAKEGDAIFQPGSPDLTPITAKHTIAELSDWTVISKAKGNPADAAIAILVEGMDHGSNTVPKKLDFPMEGRHISEPSNIGELLDSIGKDEVVCKIGRTTGFTEGLIGAVALDEVPVKTADGMVLFNDVIEINWSGEKRPFSSPGDSGSVVFTKKGLLAVGLHFAGGWKRVSGKEIGVSYSCNIVSVLAALKVTLLE